MTSSFLSLPLELREEIYYYAIDWPDLSTFFQKAQADNFNTSKILEAKPRLKDIIIQDHSIELVTPTILLLNRQITSEALPVLQRKISTPPSSPPAAIELVEVKDNTDIVVKRVPKIVRLVTLKPDSKDHKLSNLTKTVENMLDVWCQKNNEQSLHLSIENSGRNDVCTHHGETQGWRIKSTFATVGHALYS